MSRQTIEESLAEWIHEMLVDTDKGGRCTQIALVHMVGTAESDVHVKQIADKVGSDDVSGWAEMFHNRATNYAEGIPGTQTFCLFAFHNNSARPTGKKPFVVTGFVEMDGLMTEGPTGKGLLQQMMRHQEAMASRYNQKDQMLFDGILRTLDIKTRENESLRQENIQQFGFVKELVLALADRKQEHTLAQIEAQGSVSLKNELVKWGPRLLNTITGREVIPEPISDSQMVEDLIDALAEQGDAALPALGQLKLPPALMAGLAHRFQQGMQARVKEETMRKKVDDDRTGNDGLQ